MSKVIPITVTKRGVKQILDNLDANDIKELVVLEVSNDGLIQTWYSMDDRLKVMGALEAAKIDLWEV